MNLYSSLNRSKRKIKRFLAFVKFDRRIGDKKKNSFLENGHYFFIYPFKSIPNFAAFRWKNCKSSIAHRVPVPKGCLVIFFFFFNFVVNPILAKSVKRKIQSKSQFKTNRSHKGNQPITAYPLLVSVGVIWSFGIFTTTEELMSISRADEVVLSRRKSARTQQLPNRVALYF